MEPDLPEDVGPVVLVEWVVPVAYAWMQMEEKNEDLEHQLDSIRLKEKEKPKYLLQKLEHAVEEGANVKSLFHTRTKNCFWLFGMVT